ncbi:MAG: hypothetical protein ACYC6V_09005 [Bacillota bacterium]
MLVRGSEQAGWRTPEGLAGRAGEGKPKTHANHAASGSTRV